MLVVVEVNSGLVKLAAFLDVDVVAPVDHDVGDIVVWRKSHVFARLFRFRVGVCGRLSGTERAKQPLLADGASQLPSSPADPASPLLAVARWRSGFVA
jgi:hypothetical protein